MTKVTLGVYARDILTGFEGWVVAHNQYITGCDQFQLQPEIKAGEEEKGVPNTFSFDVTRLEVNTNKPVLDLKQFNTQDHAAHLKLGMFGRDRVTGFTGYISCRARYLTGSCRYSLQMRLPEGKQHGELQNTYIDGDRIELMPEVPRLVIPGLEDQDEESSADQPKKPRTSMDQKGADSNFPAPLK